MSKVFGFLDRLSTVWKTKDLGVLWQLSLVLVVFQFAFLGYFYRDLPEAVPLFYSLTRGESQLVPPFYLFLIPLFSFVCIIINIFILIPISKNHLLLVRSLILTSLLVTMMCSIALVKIVSIVL